MRTNSHLSPLKTASHPSRSSRVSLFDPVRKRLRTRRRIFRVKTAHGPRALKAYFAANFLCYFYGNAEDVIIAFGKICTCVLQSEKQSNANRISVYRQKTMSVSARAYAAPCFARARRRPIGHRVSTSRNAMACQHARVIACQAALRLQQQ